MDFSMEALVNAEYTMYCVDCNAMVFVGSHSHTQEHHMEMLQACWT